MKTYNGKEVIFIEITKAKQGSKGFRTESVNSSKGYVDAHKETFAVTIATEDGGKTFRCPVTLLRDGDGNYPSWYSQPFMENWDSDSGIVAGLYTAVHDEEFLKGFTIAEYNGNDYVKCELSSGAPSIEDTFGQDGLSSEGEKLLAAYKAAKGDKNKLKAAYAAAGKKSVTIPARVQVRKR